MFLYKNKHRIRNSISRDQTRSRYGPEHINEQNEERVIDSSQVQNLQLTVPDDSEYTCQQEEEISIELSPASGFQPSPDFSSQEHRAVASSTIVANSSSQVPEYDQ